VVSTTYKNLPNDVKKDDNILLDDGLIRLKVISKTSDTVTCKVIVDGILKEHKGINLPGVKVSAPSLTEKDQKDLIFGIEIGADFFALSFVRSAADLKKIKSLIRKHGSDIPVIAKIEKPEAIQDIDAIIERKGKFLIFETKNNGVEVPRGQEITLEQLLKLGKGNIHIMIIYGKSPKTISAIEEWFWQKKIKKTGFKKCDSNYVLGRVKKWFESGRFMEELLREFENNCQELSMK